MRPSILLGNRNEKRFGETIGKVFMKISYPFLLGKLKKYRGIHATKVAGKMISSVDEFPSGMSIFESDQI